MILALGQRAIYSDQKQPWAALALDCRTTLSQEATNPVLEKLLDIHKTLYKPGPVQRYGPS
jgi:hypothetical protein